MTKQDKDYLAGYSARYILEDFFEMGEAGIERVAQFTGLPEGVIASAFENIFHDRIEDGGEAKKEDQNGQRSKYRTRRKV